MTKRDTFDSLMPLTGFGVFMLRVGKREVGVGAARQTGAAARLGAAPPESHRGLWGHGCIGLRVSIGAGTDRVAAVGQPHLSPV